jgi:hypothetical protein
MSFRRVKPPYATVRLLIDIIFSLYAFLKVIDTLADAAHKFRNPLSSEKKKDDENNQDDFPKTEIENKW